ncbi:MAG: prepilin-type N-terminal cleavage/methylation domain-containing protein [Magnetococcus sp. YQC-3]
MGSLQAASVPDGFTLVEMTMVMVILGLLLGGLLLPLSTQLENNQRRETRERLERIHEALLGFALVHGHLPCPGRGDDGREQRAGSGCSGMKSGSVWVGELPWFTLGVGEEDAWHNRFTYAVSEPFADAGKAPLPAFTLETEGSIEIVNGMEQVPALVLSHGANGLGAVSRAGVLQPTPGGRAELENSNGDRRFEYAAYRNDPEQGFDDQMIWISPYILKNRLLLAGRMRR